MATKSRPVFGPIIRGRRKKVAEEDYKKQVFSFYQGNPCIQVLPPIIPEDVDLVRSLSIIPEYDESHRHLGKRERYHPLQVIPTMMFQPLDFHLEVEASISTMIRAGYIGRNPAHIGFWSHIEQKISILKKELGLEEEDTEDKGQENDLYLYAFDEDEEDIDPLAPSADALSKSLIGFSGMGKSTLINLLLKQYPQVYFHTEYEGNNFTHVQLTWIKIDCPRDGSLRQLCLAFLHTVDGILGTSYYKDYCKNGKATIYTLLLDMARVAAMHSTGIIVIDEIQRLNEAKSNGAKTMMNFFHALINTMGLPILIVGTPRSQKILGDDFQIARRAVGPEWKNLKFGKVTNFGKDDKKSNWYILLSTLWVYQYVKNPAPLTEELSIALYEHTQGIIDLTIKLFMLTQARAISSGKEEITVALINSVAADYFGMLKPMIEALKTGENIEKYPDIQTIDLQTALLQEVANAKNSK